MLARSVLIMEIFVMGFAMLIAKDQHDSFSIWTAVVIVLFVFFALGSLKSKLGWVLGWIAQLAMIAYGYFVFTMYFMGVIFLALWVAAIVVGRKGEAIRASRSAVGPDQKDQ